MRVTDKYLFFWGGFLSQWAKCKFTENNISFNTCEQYMMYHKAMVFSDTVTAQEILKVSDPKKQKALGRKVKGFNDKAWDLHKYQTVIQGNFLKFSQNPKLKESLLATGDKILVEASPFDRIWGIGLAAENDLVLDEKNWRGQNLLGKALMDVREKLK